MANKITKEALAVARGTMRYDQADGFFYSLSKNKKLGSHQGSGYWTVYIHDFGEVYAHRLAWAFIHGLDVVEVDHKNRDRADNRLCNLRGATRSENVRNSPKRAHSMQPYKGVRLTRSGSWQARIRVNCKEINIGHFSTAREAYEEYIFAALKFHGEYASFA